MFICQDCQGVIGPGVSPVRMIVDIRKVLYRIPDPVSREDKITAGWEIGREVSLCRPCAKMELVPVPEPYDSNAALGAAKARHEHANRCKRPLDECKLCQDNIRWFGQLPLSVLALTLQDRGPVHGSKRSIGRGVSI